MAAPATTASAVPKGSTIVQVTLLDQDKQPITGATVTVSGGDPSGAVPLTEKMKAVGKKKDQFVPLGVYLSKTLGLGDYTILANATHYGPLVVQPSPAPATPVLPTAGPVSATVNVSANAKKVKRVTSVEVRMLLVDFRVRFLPFDQTYATSGHSYTVWGAVIKLDPDTSGLVTYETRARGATQPPTVARGEHKIRLTKPGFSVGTLTPDPQVVAGRKSGVKSCSAVKDASGKVQPGVVDYAFNLVGLPTKVDLYLPLTNDWKRVTDGSGIKVGGKSFAEWYNSVYYVPPPEKAKKAKKKSEEEAKAEETPEAKPAPVRHAYPSGPIKNPSKFVEVFDNVGKLREEPLTLEEFIALFNAMMHEVGGTFKPIAERHPNHTRDDLRYMFNPGAPKKDKNGKVKRRGKASYNGGHNRPAGDLLAGIVGEVFSGSKRVLTPKVPAKDGKPEVLKDQTLIDLWNGTKFPDDLGKVTEAKSLGVRFCQVSRSYLHPGHLAWQLSVPHVREGDLETSARGGPSGRSERRRCLEQDGPDHGGRPSESHRRQLERLFRPDEGLVQQRR